MNARRFVARTSRDALAAARAAFGDDAIVLSTRPCPEGVEVLAIAGDGLAQIEQAAARAPRTAVPGTAPAGGEPPPAQPGAASAIAGLLPRMFRRGAERNSERGDDHRPSMFGPSTAEEDVGTLAMSTLSFQDYVRDRMLKRRQEALRDDAGARAAASAATTHHEAPAAPGPLEPRHGTRAIAPEAAAGAPIAPAAVAAPASVEPTPARPSARSAATGELPLLADAPAPTAPPAFATRREHEDVLAELRSVRGLIEERFGALAFMEKLQRQPGQALLAQKLLDAGLSPALTRKIADALPADAADPIAWATAVLERNLATAEGDSALEDEGGVFALVGATGVGKTTSTAKIAAAFASRHGATHLGLITLDAYRVGAQEQLRTYGRILGVPVHTAHDRASLEDLLDLLAVKRMVLIDTAGMAQRDTRTRELLEMLTHRSIKRLLVVNAAAQGETIEDVVTAYRANTCAGVVLSKVDEAVKLGPAIDAMIRHRLRVMGVANGQRVPEDWHRLSASALVQRALRSGGGNAWRLDANDVSLVFASSPSPRQARAARATAPGAALGA